MSTTSLPPTSDNGTSLGDPRRLRGAPLSYLPEMGLRGSGGAGILDERTQCSRGRAGKRKGVVVAEPLRVNPIDLHLSSDHLEVYRAEFGAAHASADADIEAAQRGWVGASAAALQAKFLEWQAATTQLSNDVEAHGAAFRAAAEGYATTDADNADSLDVRI